MNKNIHRIGLVLALGAPALGAYAAKEGPPQSVRATRLNAATWQSLKEGGEAFDVEFRRGDRLPLELSARGDFLETEGSAATELHVKRDFWLRFDEGEVLASLDGRDFHEAGDLAKGSFSVSIGAGDKNGVANSIGLGFEALLRKEP